MSPSGAQTSSGQRAIRESNVLPNGVPAPPPRGPQDMDGETVAATTPPAGPEYPGEGLPLPSRIANENIPSGETAAPSSSRATVSTTSARGFLLGPQLRESRSSMTEVPREETTQQNQTTFLGGVAKAVQAIPAVVEGLVLGHGPTGSVNQSVAMQEAEGFASAQSGSPDDSRRPPSATQLPATPLLDERTLERLNGLQASAPHLYVPEAPSSGIRPPSTSSSDIQAEVRKQVREFLAMRDEENRDLRAKLELLMMENNTLRQEISQQMYSRDQQGSRTGNSGRFGLEWIGKGFGSLLGGVTSPKPSSPPERSLDLDLLPYRHHLTRRPSPKLPLLPTHAVCQEAEVSGHRDLMKYRLTSSLQCQLLLRLRNLMPHGGPESLGRLLQPECSTLRTLRNHQEVWIHQLMIQLVVIPLMWYLRAWPSCKGS